MWEATVSHSNTLGPELLSTPWQHKRSFGYCRPRKRRAMNQPLFCMDGKLRHWQWHPKHPNPPTLSQGIHDHIQVGQYHHPLFWMRWECFFYYDWIRMCIRKTSEGHCVSSPKRSQVTDRRRRFWQPVTISRDLNHFWNTIDLDWLLNKLNNDFNFALTTRDPNSGDQSVIAFCQGMSGEYIKGVWVTNLHLRLFTLPVYGNW